MSSGERPIGAAKGTPPNTEALCQTPPFQLILRGAGYGCQAVCVGGPPRRRTRAHPLSCPCPGGVHRRPPMRFRRPPPRRPLCSGGRGGQAGVRGEADGVEHGGLRCPCARVSIPHVEVYVSFHN